MTSETLPEEVLWQILKELFGKLSKKEGFRNQES